MEIGGQTITTHMRPVRKVSPSTAAISPWKGQSHPQEPPCGVHWCEERTSCISWCSTMVWGSNAPGSVKEFRRGCCLWECSSLHMTASADLVQHECRWPLSKRQQVE